MAELNSEIQKVINQLDIRSEQLVKFFHYMLLLKVEKSTVFSWVKKREINL